jgi:RNA polymerase sigma-70 factor, ECF subfamily
VVEKAESNCLQLYVRARQHLDERWVRFEPSAEKRDALASQFVAACTAGDLDELLTLLAADTTFHGDGGGKAMAVLKPVHGRAAVSRLLLGIFGKASMAGITVRREIVKGRPDAVSMDLDEKVVAAMTFYVAGDQLLAVRSVINPDKLGHLGVVSAFGRLPTKEQRDLTQQQPACVSGASHPRRSSIDETLGPVSCAT